MKITCLLLIATAASLSSAAHWIWDDIHPTYSCHQILADEWERAVKEFWP